MMKKIYFLLSILFFTAQSFAADITWNNTVTAGNWSTPANWIGGIAPSITDNVFFVNATGVTVTIDGTFTPATITVDGGSPVFTTIATRTLAAGNGFSIINNATLTITGSAALTFATNAGASLVQLGSTLVFTGTTPGGSRLNCVAGTTIINGTLRYNVFSGNTSGIVGLSFGPSSVYQVDKNGGTVSAATYASTSLIKLTGSIANAPTFGNGANVVFGNIEFNSSTTSAAINLGFANGNSIGGDLRIINSNGQIIRLATTPPNPFSIAGNVIVNAGTLQLSNSPTTAVTFNVNGNVQVDAGASLDLQGSSTSNILNIKGNLTAPGNITEGGTSTASAIVFNGTSVQTLSFGGTIVNDVSFKIDNPAGVNVLTNFTSSAATNARLTLTNGNINMGTNTLYIQNPATTAIAGGVVASHIIGKLRRVTNTAAAAYIFPVSDNATELASIKVYPVTAVSDYTAQFIRPNPFDRNAVTPPIQNAGNYIWDIVQNTGTGADINFAYGSFNNGGITDPTAVKGLFWNGASWNTLGGTDGGGSSVDVFGVTAFGSFSLGSELNVLPIKIVYFNGIKNTGSHQLQWKVVCSNSTGGTFILERSSDGKNFTDIYAEYADVVRCLQPFSNTDNNPLAGKNYYRLKTTDIDGRITFSKTIVLLNNKTGFEIIGVLPNPVQHDGMAVLNITSAQKGKMQIIITDANGKKMQTLTSTMVAGSNQVALHVANLAAGTYLVTGITNDGIKTSTRFVKN